MIMRWNGVTIDQYEAVRNIVRWEENPAPGGLIHIATHDGSALRVVDVWENPELFNTFVNDRLMAGVQQAGVMTEPEVEIYPIHALFTPGLQTVSV